MLTEIYIEALLVDEELADQVWEAWDGGKISDLEAVWYWWLIDAQASMQNQNKSRSDAWSIIKTTIIATMIPSGIVMYQVRTASLSIKTKARVTSNTADLKSVATQFSSDSRLNETYLLARLWIGYAVIAMHMAMKDAPI